MREVTFGPATAAIVPPSAPPGMPTGCGVLHPPRHPYMPAFGATQLDEILTREFPRFGVMARWACSNRSTCSTPRASPRSS